MDLAPGASESEVSHEQAVYTVASGRLGLDARCAATGSCRCARALGAVGLALALLCLSLPAPAARPSEDANRLVERRLQRCAVQRLVTAAARTAATGKP